MKKKPVKRTLVQTKYGPQVRYYQGGKRLTEAKGRKKWVKENYEALNRPYAKDKPVLLPKEQKAFTWSRAQKELYTYKGKRIKKIVTELLKATKDLPEDGPKEITQILDPNTGKPAFRNYGELEQIYERQRQALEQSYTLAESLYGAAGWRNRTQNESATSLLESLKIVGYDGWKLVVIDQDVVYNGKVKGMEAIRRYEEREMDAAQKTFEDVSALSFTYTLDWNFTTKTITINTDDAVAQIRQSDPKKRTN